MRMTMRCSAFIAVLALALAIGRSGATATSAAQDPDMATPFEFGELEGAQRAVSRTYTVDFEAMLDGIGTPGADGQPAGIPELSGVISLAGVIGQFDSSDHAAAAVDRVDVLQLNEESTASIGNEPDAPTLREVEIDLGQTSRAYAATQEIEGQTLNLSVIIVQQDEFLYFVVGGVIEADAQSLATAFTEALIANEADTGEPQVKADGTSTGGLWAKFPKAEDELVANLVAFDLQLYPVVDATPVS